MSRFAVLAVVVAFCFGCPGGKDKAPVEAKAGGAAVVVDDDGDEVKVEAPGASVEVKDGKVKVTAPGVNIEVNE